MGRDYHSPPRHGDGTLLRQAVPRAKLRTLLAVLSLGGLLRPSCRPRGLTPSGLCCSHDVPPAPLSPGCRRTRWSRIFDGQVTMPYRERGACISQGGYILLPGPSGPSGAQVPLVPRVPLVPQVPRCPRSLPSQLEQKVPPTRVSQAPAPRSPWSPWTGVPRIFLKNKSRYEKIKYIHWLQNHFLEKFARGGYLGLKNRPLVSGGTGVPFSWLKAPRVKK